MMIQWSRMCTYAVLGVGVAMCAACNPRSSQSGEDNELQFSYQTSDPSRDFSRPLAQGASLFIRVEGAEEEAVSRIVEHGTTAAQVMQVRQSSERADELVLTGQSAGASTLVVEAVLEGGEMRSDRIGFEVAKPAQAALSHQCTTERDAGYLEGLPVQLDFERYDARRRRLVGHGACGVGFEPAGMVSRVSCDETSIRLNGTTTPGPLQMNTQLGAPSNKRNALGLQIVGFGKLDFAPVQDQLRVGSSEPIALRPQTENWTICSHLDFEAEVITPQTCSFSDGNGRRAVFTPQDLNQMRLRGESAGDCIVQVSLPVYGLPDIWEF
jgi:hypothetical protein